MIYVTYDADGNLTGKFDQELQPAHVACHIEVTAAQGANWRGYRANAARNGVEPAPAVPPTPAVPPRVPMLNAHLVMIEAGWYEPLLAYIDTLPAKDRLLALAWLNKSPTMVRDHSLVQSIPAALGKTEAEVDQLFIDAGALNV